MKKYVLVGISVLIVLILIVVVVVNNNNDNSNNSINSLYLPPDGTEEPSSTYYEASTNSSTNTVLTEEEKKILQQTLQESEEYQKENEKARDILRKYNPDTFDELYESNVKYLEKQKVHGSEITDEQKKLYKMLIDTYENDNLNENEREILKQQIE